MAVWATVSDVTSVWDGSAPSERVQALLDRAELLLLARVSDLADRVADGSTSASLVAVALSNMVVRHLNNPRGFQSEHAGEVGYSFGVGGGAGQLSVSDEDLALLGVEVGYMPRSIRVSVPADRGCGWWS